MPSRSANGTHVLYGNATFGNIAVPADKHLEWLEDTPHRGWSFEFTNLTAQGGAGNFTPRWQQAFIGSALQASIVPQGRQLRFGRANGRACRGLRDAVRADPAVDDVRLEARPGLPAVLHR